MARRAPVNPMALRIEVERARRLKERLVLDDPGAETALIQEQTFIPDILGRIVEALAETDALIDAAKQRQGELKDRIDRYERRNQRLIDIASETMDAIGHTSLDIGSATVIVTPAKSSVIITDEALVPDEFKVEKVTHTVSKTLVRPVLDAGQRIPGVELSNPQRSLSVRRTQ